MALMIGGTRRPAPPVEEPMEEAPMDEMPVEDMPVEEEMVEEPPMEEPMMEQPQAGLVDPTVAGYKGPEMGPFMCGNCQFYSGEGECMILAAPVEEEGLCNLFMSMPSSESIDEELPMEPEQQELPFDEEEIPAEPEL